MHSAKWCCYCLPTKVVNTFKEYADQVFIPYLTKQLQDSIRADLDGTGVYQGEERQGCVKEGIW